MEIFLPGACVPKGRPRVTINRKTHKFYAFTPERTRRYAAAARKVAKNAYGSTPPVDADHGVIMNVEFVRRESPNKRPDIINMLSQVADLLTTVAYDDDSQVVEIHAYKRKGKMPVTRVEIVTGEAYPSKTKKK